MGHELQAGYWGTEQTTKILQFVQSGDRSAAEVLFTRLYGELRHIAGALLSRERPGGTLQATALVHEVYLKMVDQSRTNWQGRAHFCAIAARVMRRILIDHARARGAARRGGSGKRVDIEDALVVSRDRLDDVLLVNGMLERLEKLDPRQAQILELRFFGGLTVPEVAEAMKLSTRTIEAEWTMTRAWLRREFSLSGS